MAKKKTDEYKAVAEELASKVLWAISHLHISGMPMLTKPNANGTEYEFQHWHDYLMESVRKLPGIDVDEEFFQTMRLPAKERAKAQKSIMKKREAECA